MKHSDSTSEAKEDESDINCNSQSVEGDNCESDEQENTDSESKIDNSDY